MKKLCAITDGIYSLIISQFPKFSTEKEVARFINKQFKLHGVKPAFRTIVANNSAEIHHWPTKKRLARGFVIIDIGARDKGISCDMSRTFFIGKPTTREKMLYTWVKKCQEKCCRKVCAGAWGDDLDMYARKTLGKYTHYFLHSLGHGVGEKIHQKPWISTKRPCRISKGDFITIEPGIYIKGKHPIGIRIEDTLYVGKKVEILTKSKKELVCLPHNNL